MMRATSFIMIGVLAAQITLADGTPFSGYSGDKESDAINPDSTADVFAGAYCLNPSGRTVGIEVLAWDDGCRGDSAGSETVKVYWPNPTQNWVITGFATAISLFTGLTQFDEGFASQCDRGTGNSADVYITYEDKYGC